MAIGRKHSSVLFIALGMSMVWTAAQVHAAGTVSGQVTDATTGLGIDLCVDIFDNQGDWINNACTAAGLYSSNPLESGTYFVATSNWSGYYDEVYNDIPCNPMCDVTIGTPVVVGDGDVQGIDFVLQPGGGWFNGELTDAANGAGVAFTAVQVYDSSGTVVTFGWANPPNGYYNTKGALETGTYYAVTSPPGYLGELYDDLPCPGFGCDPTAGTPINVTAGAGTSGIDFVLLPELVFIDGFESGNTSGWSISVGESLGIR